MKRLTTTITIVYDVPETGENELPTIIDVLRDGQPVASQDTFMSPRQYLVVEDQQGNWDIVASLVRY